MILIVGATGMVGGEICRLLRERGRPVRAMVRETSNPDKVAQLKTLGAELVRGDLKHRASLDDACRAATAVISTASSTQTRQAGDTLASVDQEGQVNLVDAARRSGVQHFILISFPPVDMDFPLQTAKRAAEDAVRQSGMTYTILQPTCFTEVWLSPALGFDAKNGTARIYGSGDSKISWISFQDVAKFAVAALEDARARNAVIKLGGPEALSPNDVVRLAEQMTAKKFVVERVPEEALRSQYHAATDPMQQSFAALMLYAARGETIDMRDTLRKFPVGHLKSVRDHLAAAGGFSSAGTSA